MYYRISKVTSDWIAKLTPDELDRAYSDGRIVGFFQLATKAGCPHGHRARDLRIAWLDGFAYGAWEAASQVTDADGTTPTTGHLS